MIIIIFDFSAAKRQDEDYDEQVEETLQDEASSTICLYIPYNILFCFECLSEVQGKVLK